MTLPRIGAMVPRTIAPRALLAANASLSRFLIDADAFDEEDIPPTWTDSLDACKEALDHWIKRQIGPLHCLNPRFGLHLLSGNGYYSVRNDPKRGFDFDTVEVAWGECDEQEWPVGAALEALNRRIPGLGVVVLHVMHRQGTRAYPVFTPDLAREQASYLYWYGEDDEELALEECHGDDQEAREAMREEMVCKATLDAAYPAWALRWPQGLELPQCARLLRRAIRYLHSTGDETARAVAEDALALATLALDDAFRPEIEGDYIGFGAVLSWSEGDVTTRIYDDLRNSAYQGEYCATMGEIQVPVNDPGAFSAWQRAMADHFEAIRLIDALIHRLSAGDWSG